MARHVILTFEDNDEAEAFVKAVQATIEQGTPPFAFIGSSVQDSYLVRPVEKGVSVVGMYMKPTAFCDCAHPGDKSVRGAKYGLFIHAACAKPKSGIWQYPRNLLWKETIKELVRPGVDRRFAMLGIQEGGESPPLIDLNVKE